MSGEAEVVHVVWGSSRAATLRTALRTSGDKARIIALQGPLNFGPINPPDPNVRQTWIRTVLRPDPCDDHREPMLPWREATSADVHPVYWVCMSDAAEHAAFLEFAFRMNGRPFDIIDATNLDFVTRDGVRRPWSLGIMRCEDIVSSGLKEMRRVFSRIECDAAAATWAGLRSENAPLRVVREGCLVSAPLTHYDATLMSQVAADWEVAARLIGRTMHHLSVEIEPPGQDVSDVVLFGRMQALGDAGSVEIQGNGPGMRDYEARRCAAYVSPQHAKDKLK